MVDRICISINNRCNLACRYCHFHEKKQAIHNEEMNVYKILDNVIESIETNHIKVFKIGFVGNGEPLLDIDALQKYVLYISEYLKNGKIAAYTITNGLLLSKDMIRFFKKYYVDVGISIDGISSIHNKYRCGTHAEVMMKIEMYRDMMGKYPSMNCTVGTEALEHTNETITFFEQFENKITFSRMIGEYGITLNAFNGFMQEATKRLNVRKGGYDCTMYGGLCGAGMNNFFYSNGNVYLCGNCIELPPIGKSNMPLSDLISLPTQFDRTQCYKECLCK